MNCNCTSVAPSALMAAPTLLHRHHTFPSHSFPSPINPASLNPQPLASPKPPPQNPPKTSVSFSSLTLSLRNSRKSRTHFSLGPQDPVSKDEARERRLEEAREAIREYLEQLGASGEDASRICLNCPNYLKMLIDGVDDIEEWNSWAAAAGTSQETENEASEFKKRVYEMAKQKGDDGVIPLLESLGLSLSTATHLARYLSSSGSNDLPLLIHKVKYVKELLFSDDDNEIIGKNAVRMMAHLSISADEDVQQTLAFFQKIQARRGGLNLLGSENASFRYLIESFPRLLYPRLESRIKPIVKFLEDIGVPKGCVRNILLLFPPMIAYDIDKVIKPRLQSFEKIGAKDDDLGGMLVKYPWILSASIQENFENILDFFDDEKVPGVCSSRAIKNWPHILGCSVDKMEIMVEQFGKMDIGNKKLGQVIAKSPQLLLRKPREFAQMVSFFSDLGLDKVDITRTLARCPEIFASSIDGTLKKKLEFLSTVGVYKTHFPRVIRKYPELLVCDVDKALRPRVRYLMKSGFSNSNVASMLCRFSPILGYSIEQVLRPKLEFLVNTMGRPLSDVFNYPRYFSYSLEKRIKPRYWVLKSRNIEFSLQEMLGKNDEEFVADYLGVGEMNVPSSS